VLVFCGRLAPLTVKVAVPFGPEAESVALPSETFPVVNVTDPEGAVVPLAGLIRTVTAVVAPVAIKVDAAVSAAVVATGVGVTVSVTEPVDDAKLPVGVKIAVIVFDPDARFDPFTVIEADPDVPDTTSVADPSEVLPALNATVPAGATDPDAGLTVAAIWVLALWAMVEGVAERTVDVATAGAVSKSDTDSDAVAKPTVPP